MLAGASRQPRFGFRNLSNDTICFSYSHIYSRSFSLTHLSLLFERSMVYLLLILCTRNINIFILNLYNHMAFFLR